MRWRPRTCSCEGVSQITSSCRAEKRATGTYPEVLVNLLYVNVQHWVRGLDSCGVVVHDFDVLALCQVVQLGEHLGNGFEIAQVGAQCIDFDIGSSLLHKWDVFIGKTIGVAPKKYYVVDAAFGCERRGNIIANARASAEQEECSCHFLVILSCGLDN